MNPFAFGLVFFRFILYDEPIHLWTYSFNLPLRMNPFACGLVFFKFILYDKLVHL